MPTPIAQIKKRALALALKNQCDWAARAGIALERPDYALVADGNLHRPLSITTRNRLEDASGSELKRTWKGKRPPKFHALKSSSALACNVFEYWEHDLSALQQALNSPYPLSGMEAEAKYPTGSGGVCNLDFALMTPDRKWALAIESKFMEPVDGKKAGLKPAYLPPNGLPTPWKSRGLNRCHDLARHIEAHPDSFSFVDVPQLLKHILGLHNKLNNSFRLLYVWYELGGEAGTMHLDEVRRFKEAVGGEIDFDTLTYQTLVSTLRQSASGDNLSDYFDYLRNRYQLG